MATALESFMKNIYAGKGEDGIAAHKQQAAASIQFAPRSDTSTEQLKPLTSISANTRVSTTGVGVLEQGLAAEECPVITESAVKRTVNEALAQCGDIDSDFDAKGYRFGYCDVEYVHEIYAYLLHQERSMKIDIPIKRNTEGPATISGRDRAKLINWVAKMHWRHSLAIESLFLAAQLIDRYLTKCHPSFPVQQLKLLGLTALFTASKFEESYSPSLGGFLAEAHNEFTRSQVSKQEFEMLETLGFNLAFPTAITFIRRYATALGMDNKTRYRAFFYAELCLRNHQFARVLPSELAASTCIVSRRVAGFPNDQLWPEELEGYSTHSRASLKMSVDMVLSTLSLVSPAESIGGMFDATTEKYTRRGFPFLEELPALKTAGRR